MSIRNLKDGTKKPWLCECYPQGRSGKRVRKRFATKGEATAYEKFVLKEIDDKPWLGEKADHRRLSEIVDLWFVLHGKNLKSGEHTKGRMQHIVTALGDPLASQITPKQLAHYRANRTFQQGKNPQKEIAISSNNRDMTCLKAVFNKLIEFKEWQQPNPLDGIKNIKTPESELTFLRQGQIIKLFDVIKASDYADDLRIVFMICLATGARINEAILLKGEHVFDNKVTYVNTKGKRNRTLPISQTLYDDINPQKSGRLFTCNYKIAHKWLVRALPDLPNGQATHVLRHTFATNFMRNGGNILDLKEALGHSKIEQTMVYAHFSPNHLESVVRLNPIANLTL
ncbi:tyrosine-type recombinase/integrase [Vibrio sp. 10N.261.55.A7]|uniref:phage integrase n=1 Tax=Vibrio sp. 10N.261.55.A7 TaxID=1880851 RepID=UPI000C84BCF0|nr:tyrosine-type recombinase/integrase [Vibrio sp. 10N.261.55.A7]PMJ92834.1 integrase [Vibrio sp. 10N.261.55.A7]